MNGETVYHFQKSLINKNLGIRVKESNSNSDSCVYLLSKTVGKDRVVRLFGLQESPSSKQHHKVICTSQHLLKNRKCQLMGAMVIC